MRPLRTANKFLHDHRSRGQGTLEFILILVVMVGLILIFSGKVIKPFSEYTQSYMGDYLACLLDKGVLPKLKSEDDSCSTSLKLGADNPFNPKNAGKTQAVAAQAKSELTNRPTEIKEMSQSRSGGAASSTNASSTTGIRPRFNTPRTADAGGGSGDEKVTSIPNPLAESKYYKVSRFGSAGSGPGTGVRAVGLSGLLQGERDRLARREQRISRAGIVESESELGKPKKMRVKVRERKIAEEAEAEPMTFGKFARILIILAIILAIIVFMATQTNQISKSWEK